MKRRVVLLFVAALLAACGSSSSPAPGRIAFDSDRDGNSEIYVMNADGSGLTNLTNNLAVDWDPAWSPDGSRIAFVSDRDGNREVYVMNSDGTGQTRLTDNPAGDWSPAWSPDGGRIAFMSDRDGNYEIYVINADGSGLTNLTNNPASDDEPTWSPDGTRIAFISERVSRQDNTGEVFGRTADGTVITFTLPTVETPIVTNLDIYIVNADGTGQTRLTDKPFEDRSPAWSPDGRRIAFESGRDSSSHIEIYDSTDGTLLPLSLNTGIYVMNADGTGQTRLTNDPDRDTRPAWSPDGGRIAFYRTLDLYVMRPDGSRPTRLTHGDEVFFAPLPLWSPDGKRIAFTSDHDGNFEIYVMNADGTGRVNLTNNPADDSDPAWSP